MGCEIVFKIVYEVYGLMENFFVFTAVHEERFRTEHFGNLGEDGRSAFGDEKVGKTPTAGLAVMPDRPSEPPHFMPIISSLQGMGSRFAVRA